MRKYRLAWLAAAAVLLSLGVGWWALTESDRPAEEADAPPAAADVNPPAAPRARYPRPAPAESPNGQPGAGLSGRATAQ
jgi:hypothetical protein